MGWLIALGILILLAILPLGVHVLYNAEGVRIGLIIGPFKLTLIPAKHKKKKKEKEEKPKTEEKPKEENKKAERNTTDNKFHIRALKTTKKVFQLIHRLRKVERNETTDNTQKYHIGNTLHGERVSHSKMEHGFRTRSNI